MRSTATSLHQGIYPCLCLCLGFSQIILMLPFLLMTLHFSQIGLTDDLTFTAKASFQTSSVAIISQPFLSTQGKFYKIYIEYFVWIFLLFYLSLQMILPFVKSYGDNSIVTLSPGRILIKFILNLPLIVARI